MVYMLLSSDLLFIAVETRKLQCGLAREHLVSGRGYG